MIFLLFGVLAACLFDYSKHKIPNFLIAVLFLFNFINLLQTGGISETGKACLVMIVVLFAFYPFFCVGMLGAGDVKLLTVASGYLEGGRAPEFLLCVFAAAAIPAIGRILLKGGIQLYAAELKLYLNRMLGNRRLMPYERSITKWEHSQVILSGPILVSVLMYMGGII